MVNMMSNEEDLCFQCQGTRTHHTTLPSHQMSWMWWIGAYCHRLTSQNTSFRKHWHHITRHTGVTTPDQALGTAKKIVKRQVIDHSLDIADIAALAIVTHTEATPDHSNEMGMATIEAAQDDPIQHTEDTVTDPTMTHHTDHTTNHPYTTVHQDTALKTAVDHIHAHPTDHWNINHTKEDPTVQDCTPIREPENHTLAGIERST